MTSVTLVMDTPRHTCQSGFHCLQVFVFEEVAKGHLVEVYGGADRKARDTTYLEKKHGQRAVIGWQSSVFMRHGLA